MLYELTSYYLFVHLFLLTFHVYHLKNATRKLTPFACTLGTTAFHRWRRSYLFKSACVASLLALNLSVLVLMASTQRKAYSQGWFMVFQVFILVLYLVALRREYVCLEKSPFYAFGLYFLATFLFLLSFTVLYALTGEHCYSMTCVVSGEKQPSTCQFCKVIPIFDSSISVSSQDRAATYTLSRLGVEVMWGYVGLSMAVSLLVLAAGCWEWGRRPPNEGEIFEEYISTKHIDVSLQEDYPS